jgi:putative hydrolases of HD superfamily
MFFGDRLKDLIDLLALKDVQRAGWVRVGITQPESVAAHSWGMLLLASVLTPSGLNKERIFLMCITHDLPEIEAGDITPFDNISKSEKQKLESQAADKILSNRPVLFEAWNEYMENITPESQFVHALDKLDMALQAKRYSSIANTDEFIKSALQHLPEKWKVGFNLEAN